MDEKKLRESLDACRPHHSDLAAPEMDAAARAVNADPHWQTQLQRMHQFDAAVSAAIQSPIEMPPGLADRLLARVRSAQAESPVVTQNSTLEHSVVAATTTAVNATSSASEDITTSAAKTATSNRSKKWLAFPVTVTALALVVLVASVAWYRSPETWTRDSLRTQGATWVASLPNDWQSPETAPEKNYPLGAAVTAPPRAWQTIATRNRGRAVVYDLKRNGSRAWLFVIPVREATSFTSSLSRLPSSAGWGMGAWKEGNALYLLVVDETRERLEAFVRPPRSVAQSHSSHVTLI